MAEDQRVIELIDEMAAGRVDLIAFTSSPQVQRLRQVAKESLREAVLQEAFRRTTIAAVGPIVARAIEQAGGHVSIGPSDPFVSWTSTVLQPARLSSDRQARAMTRRYSVCSQACRGSSHPSPSRRPRWTRSPERARIEE
jgi:Uroporphyrinogen-III synthase HemD